MCAGGDGSLGAGLDGTVTFLLCCKVCPGMARHEEPLDTANRVTLWLFWAGESLPTGITSSLAAVGHPVQTRQRLNRLCMHVRPGLGTCAAGQEC